MKQKHDWQCCPKCNGSKQVYYTVDPFATTSVFMGYKTCYICYGDGIISQQNGLPPSMQGVKLTKVA